MKLLTNEKFIESLSIYSNQMILEPKRSETKVVVVTGDREGGENGGKTTSALKIIYERYIHKNEKFIWVIKYKEMIKDSKIQFLNFGWVCLNGVFYDTNNGNEIVGFITDINRPDNAKVRGYRQHNITTMIVEEVVPENGKTDHDTGKKISSIISSVFGNNKLKKWKELGIMLYFFTNCINNDHPVLYLFGISDTVHGITYKDNKEIACISIVDVNIDYNDIDPLLTMGGYAKVAYGRALSLQTDIIVLKDFDFTGWKLIANIELFNNFGSIYFKSNQLLILDEIKENKDEVICIGSENKMQKVNYSVLKKLFGLCRTNNNKILFSEWGWKKLLIKAFDKYSAYL